MSTDHQILHWRTERMDRITEVICLHFLVTKQELNTEERKQIFVKARHVLWYFLYCNAGIKHKEIAQEFKQKRSAITHAILNIKDQLKIKQYVYEDIMTLKPLVEQICNDQLKKAV